MIRVFRLRVGESFATATERAPDFILQAPIDDAHLRPFGLEAGEVELVRDAVRPIAGTEEVDLVYSHQGKLFRKLRREPLRSLPVEVVTAPVAKLSFATSPAPILVGGEHAGCLAAACEALDFLGYAVRPVVVDGQATLVAVASAWRPAVLVLTAKAWTLAAPHLPEIRRACAPIAFVRVGSLRAEGPERADATIDAFKLEAMAPLLDPVIARLRSPSGGH